MIKFKPKRLSKKQIWEIAEEFRSKHKFASQFPVDVEKLIEFNLGMDIIPMSGLKSLIEVEAFLSKDLRKIYIDKQGYENSRYLPRHRFTLAEEVGHFVLHKDIYLSGVNYDSEEEFIHDVGKMDPDDLDWVEYQARQFAGRLLVPIDQLEDRIIKSEMLIRSFYERYDGNDDAEDFVIEGFSKKICNEFEVSFNVIKYRIYHENLSHYFKN